MKFNETAYAKLPKLRECSFNPVEHLELYEYKDGNKSFGLDVRWRMVWFHAWCMENGHTGVIREDGFTTVPGTPYVVANCSILVDGEVIANGVAECVAYSGSPEIFGLRRAMTAAKGRALANAGFGTVFAGASPAENGGNELPDEGFTVEEISGMLAANDPLRPLAASTNAPAPAPVMQPAPQQPIPPMQTAPMHPAQQLMPPAPPQAPALNMTREEAMRFQAPSGHYEGTPFGELYGINKKSLEFFATKGKTEAIRTAAAIVLDINGR